MKKRKVLFITERRADYSRLKPIMRAVLKSRKLKLQLVVTGMHLLPSFGRTEKFIKKDGFKIDARLPIFSAYDPDSGQAMVKALGRALLGFAEIFDRLKPDIIFAGFDIGANFAAAVAGMHMNIHVAHIQGGERSGTIDEVIRHGLTKFAHIHFAATKKSAERIIKLGENPRYVFCVGSPSLDTIHKLNYRSKDEVFKDFKLDKNKKLIVFLQHPVTSEVDQVVKQISESISAIKKITLNSQVQTLAVYSNNDAGGKRIVSALKASDIKVFPHIVYENFLELLKHADVLVGNSSAGIHEAPSYGLPVVNIGTRQQFRERGQNVIDTGYNRRQIADAIKKALFDSRFRLSVKRGKNPYDRGLTAKKIVKILENIKLPPIQKIINY